MQSRENPIVDNEILEPSKPRRRQKVRVRPQHSAAVANRRLSVGRFRPRKQDNVLKETSKQKTSITAEKKVVGRPRMRRPPSLRTPQPRSPSPSAIMKSIKRMRIRGRARPSTASQPSSQGTTMAGRVETSTDKRSLSSSLSSSSSSSSRCSFPQSWRGKWFHLGFPEPLRISEDAIAGKGRCVRQSGKNMFLLKER